MHTQIREEVALTSGRILVKGQKHKRGPAKYADYILYYKPNIPIAVIEAKDNNHSMGAGMQQALDYSAMLGDGQGKDPLPFVFSSNGDGFLFHDYTATDGTIEKALSLSMFPSPEQLWERYCSWKGFDEPARKVISQDYHLDESGNLPASQTYLYTTVNIPRLCRGIFTDKKPQKTAHLIKQFTRSRIPLMTLLGSRRRLTTNSP